MLLLSYRYEAKWSPENILGCDGVTHVMSRRFGGTCHLHLQGEYQRTRNNVSSNYQP
jgi:hypothetical protein